MLSRRLRKDYSSARSSDAGSDIRKISSCDRNPPPLLPSRSRPTPRKKTPPERAGMCIFWSAPTAHTIAASQPIRNAAWSSITVCGRGRALHSLTPPREVSRLPSMRRPFSSRTPGAIYPVSAPLQETRLFPRNESRLPPFPMHMMHMDRVRLRAGARMFSYGLSLRFRRTRGRSAGMDRTPGLRYQSPSPASSSGRRYPAVLWRLPCSFPAKRCCRFSLPR